MKIKQTQTEKRIPDSKAILRIVAQYRYLTVNQLQAILRISSYNRARNILFALWKHGFLERLILTKASRWVTYIYVFALSQHGGRQLSSSGQNRIFYLKPGDKRSTVFLEHTILINDFRICLERLENLIKGFSLESWKQTRREVKIKFG